MPQVTVREVREEDCDEIFHLWKECTVNPTDKFKGDIETFRCNWFGKEKRFYGLVAEDQNNSKSGSPKLIGVLHYSRVYGTWAGEFTMMIDEIIIKDENRRQEICSALYEKAIQLVVEKRCLQQTLFIRNSDDINTLKRLGACNATDVLDWNILTLSRDKMRACSEKKNRLLSGDPFTGKGDRQADTTVTRVHVRDACADDCDEILRLTKELVIFENEADRLKNNKENFRESCFDDVKQFHCFVVEDRDSVESERPRLIAFLLYAWMYKAWQGSYTMYIEDVFVTEKNRRRGVGRALFEQAITTAASQDYNSICLSARKQNTSAINFYKSFGFINETEENGLTFLINETF